MCLLRTEHPQVKDTIALALSFYSGKIGELNPGLGDNQFSALAEADAALAAVAAQQHPAPDATFRLERAAVIIKPGMDDLAAA